MRKSDHPKSTKQYLPTPHIFAVNPQHPFYIRPPPLDQPPRLKSKAMQAAQGKVTPDHPNRNVKPAPASTPSPSPTPPATPPKTFAKSNRGATSPLFGASGVSRLRLRSMPAFDGNVGNISFAFGLGSSRKYGCERHVAASGREAGFSARRWERRVRPAVVR